MLYLYLFIWGIIAGVSSGIFGIGGGVLLVPAQIFHSVIPIQAVATSSLAIFITALAGSFRYYRENLLNLPLVIKIAIPAVFSAQLGVYIANLLKPWLLLMLFGLLLWLNIILVLNKKEPKEPVSERKPVKFETFSYILTGFSGGLLSGLFGVGGGLLMVPLQIILLGIGIKNAIANSLAIIVVTSIAAVSGHAIVGNVNLLNGLCMGAGGVAGAQLGTRIMIRLPAKVLRYILLAASLLISLLVFYDACMSYLKA